LKLTYHFEALAPKLLNSLTLLQKQQSTYSTEMDRKERMDALISNFLRQFVHIFISTGL